MLHFWDCNVGVLVVFFSITFDDDDDDDDNNNNNTYQLKVHSGSIQRIFYYIAILRYPSVFIWRNNLAVYLCVSIHICPNYKESKDKAIERKNNTTFCCWAVYW
jgi:hypothetical protein